MWFRSRLGKSCKNGKGGFNIKIGRKNLERYKLKIKLAKRCWRSGRALVRCSFHPNCHTSGNVYLHRLIKEVEIGRYLRKDEIVHHIDGNYHNRDPLNLKIQGESEHHIKHGLDIGREWYAFNCPLCDVYFEKWARVQNGAWNREKERQGPFCSRSCASKAVRMISNDGDHFGRTKIVRRFKKFSKKRYGLTKCQL